MTFPKLALVEHGFASIGDVRLHYVEAGEGEPVVLLHGWPQHHWAWRLVIPRLVEAGRYVIAPDMRGFGWSDAPRSSYEKGELAGDVMGLLDELEIERAVVAGHDWGGYVAFLCALQAPDRFERVEAFGINHPWSRRPDLRGLLSALAYQPLIATPFVGPFAQRFTPFFSVVHRIGGLPERGAYLSVFRDADRAEAASRLYRSFLLKESRRAPAGPLEVPARLTIGSRDPIMSRSMLETGTRHMPAGFEVDVIDGAGHWLPEEVPDEVTERILGH